MTLTFKLVGFSIPHNRGNLHISCNWVWLCLTSFLILVTQIMLVSIFQLILYLVELGIGWLLELHLLKLAPFLRWKLTKVEYPSIFWVKQDWVAFMSQPYWVEVKVEVDMEDEVNLKLRLKWGWHEVESKFSWNWVELVLR